MAFKKTKSIAMDVTSPQALFRDLKNRKIQGILEHQSTMIDDYMSKYYNDRDVALELPTGSGKTLVGLLLGEYRRIKEKNKIVYICPTVQLVNQVVEQSKEKYGIKTTGFSGNISNYSSIDKASYIANKSIAVTTYSAFFNNRTFFDDADILIFDDAHSADSYISKFWTVDINRYESNELYMRLVNILKDCISDIAYERMISQEYTKVDLDWVDKIPMTMFIDKQLDIVSSIDMCDMGYFNNAGWGNIRDYLHACNMFISYNSILIKPMIPPTKTFAPFNNAKQRIYMSATLGDSGELERITGIDSIKRIAVPSGWDKQGLGRRFFLFPSAIFEPNQVKDLMIDLIKKEKRSIILVPDEKKAEAVSNIVKDKTDYSVYRNSDIKSSKKGFVAEEKSVAILANRFDGMDFEGDECRLLFLLGVPSAMNLQERFFITRLATAVLFNERIRTRLIQAIGRCTRGPVDFSAVCVIGTEIEKELVPYEKQKLLHPEVQAEIAFGYENSMELSGLDEALENFDIFMEHGDDWDDADCQILERRNEIHKNENPTFSKLKDAAVCEVRYQYSLWNKDYCKALNDVSKILSYLNDNYLTGYRGYWYYIASCLSELQSQKSSAIAYRNKALACTKGITWLGNIVYDENNIKNNKEKYNDIQIESIEKMLLKFGPGNRKYERYISDTLNELNSSGVNVENGLNKLGKILGFTSENKKNPAAPDTYWILNNGVCLISECKIKESVDTAIDVENIREAKTHREWLISQGVISKETITYTVFITNSKYIHKDAIAICNDIYCINIKDIISFSHKVFNIISQLRCSFVDEGDINWRNKAIDILNSHKEISNEVIVNKVLDNPITKLDMKK